MRVIQAHFSFNMHGLHAENIRQQNAAAGGGIMDVGCYCASMARLVAGAALGQDFADPLEVKGCGHIGAGNRVDEWAAATLRFPGDIVANLTCGIQVSTECTLRIWGSEGHIVVPNPWFPGAEDNEILVYHDGQQEPERVLVAGGTGLYTIEADTVARCLQKQEKQAPAPCMTWADSLGNMATLDRWRQEIGLVFDMEKPEALARAHRRTAPGAPARPADDLRPGGRGGETDLAHRHGHDGLPSAITCPSPAPCWITLSSVGGNCLDTAYVYGTESHHRPVDASCGAFARDLVLIGKGAHTPECYPEALTRQLTADAGAATDGLPRPLPHAPRQPGDSCG